MRVEFEKLAYYDFAKKYLDDLGLNQSEKSEILKNVQMGAAVVARGWCSAYDRELTAAVRFLREEISQETTSRYFEVAVGILVTAIAGMSRVDLLAKTRLDLLIKYAASEMGLNLEIKGADFDHDLESCDTDHLIMGSVWDLINCDEEYLHGEIVSISNSSVIKLRDELANATNLSQSSASRVITSAVTVGRVLARSKETEECHKTAILKISGLKKSLSISRCAVILSALADQALARLDANDSRFADMGESQMAIIAMAAPFADNLKDLIALIKLPKTQQMRIIKKIGNAARSWLANAEREEKYSFAKIPGLRCALDSPAASAALPAHQTEFEWSF